MSVVNTTAVAEENVIVPETVPKTKFVNAAADQIALPETVPPLYEVSLKVAFPVSVAPLLEEPLNVAIVVTVILIDIELVVEQLTTVGSLPPFRVTVAYNSTLSLGVGSVDAWLLNTPEVFVVHQFPSVFQSVSVVALS